MKSRTASRALASASRPASRPLRVANVRFESTSTTGNSSQSSSAEASTSWQPVLPAGQNPAYDAALSFLDNRKSTANACIEKLRSQSATPENEAEIRRLEISSLVNDPATRRLFRQTAGKGLMDRPVMRHLAKRRWEKEGGLDRLMQRVEQLGVVPDLIGGIGGSLPIQFSTAEQGEVEPGSQQPPSSYRTPPTLNVQLLDDLKEGLYTLLVVDPDSPVYETQSFGQRLHYAKTDIKLTPTESGEVDLFTSGSGTEVLSWEPPLPPKGSGVHRYVFFLLRQPNSTSASNPTSLAPGIERTGFELRQLLEQGHQVAAVTLFRSKWSADENEYIEHTYREVHGTEVPVFEKAPKELKYGMPLSKKGMEREQLREEAWNKALSDIVGDEGEVKAENRV